MGVVSGWRVDKYLKDSIRQHVYSAAMFLRFSVYADLIKMRYLLVFRDYLQSMNRSDLVQIIQCGATQAHLRR